MKAKNLTLMSLSILSLIVLISFASAITISPLSTPTSVDDDAGTYTFTLDITNNETDPVNISFTYDITGVAGTSLSFSPTSITNLENSTSKTITGTVSGFSTEGGKTMTIAVTATETEDSTNSDSYAFEVNIKSTIPEEVNTCTTTGNPGTDLRVKSIDFTNKGMKMGDTTKEFGEDDAWFPLDDIEVEITIENNGNDDIDNIEVDWGLWDTQSNEWVIELDDEKDFDLKDDDDETLTISFNLESSLDIGLEDLNNGNNYRFYVIATGENTDIDADVCAYDSEDAEIVIESDFVALSDFEFLESVSCAEEVQIIAGTWNIGDRDQDDVYVRVYNDELKINKNIDIGDIDAFDNEDLNIIFQIPADAKEKTYQLNFIVYDEDEDVYETDFDDDKAEFYIPLTVAGCTTQAKAIVSASLESGGIAGEELVIRTTIVNSGDDTATYDLNLAGFASWANSGNIDATTITLNKGEQKDVLAAFNVKEDVSGDQNFNIEVLSNGDFVLTQPVAVTIEEAQKGFFSGITGNAIGGGNTYLWIIGILNVLLVVIIIIVAIRVARK